MKELRDEMITAKNEMERSKNNNDREITNLKTNNGMPVKEVKMKAIETLREHNTVERVADIIYKFLDTTIKGTNKKNVDVVVNKMFTPKTIGYEKSVRMLNKFDHLFEDNSKSDDFGYNR